MKENRRKCVKCGASPAENPGTAVYRFPKPGSTNALRCEQWAKYAFPDKPWANLEFQNKLHSEHKMLCHRHFKESAFVDYPTKKLRRFASPDAEDITLPFLQVNFNDPTPGPSRPLADITNKPVLVNMSEPVRIVSKTTSTSTRPGTNEKNFTKCQKYVRKICLLRKQLKYMKNKKFLHTLSTSDAVDRLSNKISPTFALLLQGQIRNFKRSSKGRRWTTEDKITALRLYKRSPTCYRLLRRMFCLPAPTSLKILLGKWNLNVGINEQLFEIIGKFTSQQIAVNNEYVLMFDEMSLRKHLQYNPKEDHIEGFQDHGAQGREAQPASYALVFMIAGIRRKIKQPLAYYLSGSSVTADRLAVLIKEVLQQCDAHGVNIAATVCDMDGVNRRALSILGANVSCPQFEFNNRKVIALFDPPHLIKCFRNLFLKYDVQCPTTITSDGKQGTGVAKWQHIIQFYELDNNNPNFVFAPCLRQEHLNPNNKQKMRVKLAVQVLSHTVAAGMFAKLSQGELTADAAVTADLITKMDKLFDTFNSDSTDLRRGKPFSTNLKNSSPHIQFIKEMIQYFQKIKFLRCKTTPPSQEGWAWTLKGMEMLWESLRQRHNSIKSLATRRFQQDPLENLFGCIRSNCGSNSNPTSGQFVAGLKTSIFSKLSHIGSGNCELDNNEVIVENFKTFLKKCSQTESNENNSIRELNENMNVEIIEESGEVQACAYVCGFIIKNYKNECNVCIKILTSNDREAMHTFIQFKEYDDFKESLNYACKDFVLCVQLCAIKINEYLIKYGYKRKLLSSILITLKQSINFDFLNDCTEHKVNNINYILKSVSHIVIKRYCAKQNRIYSEQSAAIALKKKINILKHV